VDTRDFSYQNKLIEDSLKHLAESKICLLAACPGAGKTNMAIKIMQKFLEIYPNKRVLILTHGQNILRHQFSKRMESLGVKGYQTLHGGEGRKGVRQILVTLPQTIEKHTDKIKADLVIIDEAHQFYTSPMVQKIIEEVGAEYRLLLTGTPSKFVGKIPIVHITLMELIEKKILLDPQIIMERIDLGNIKISDYDHKRELNPKKLIEGASVSCIEQLLKKNNSSLFQRTMIIAKKQDQAIEIHEFLIKQGYLSHLCISSQTRDSESIFQKFKNNGNFLIVVNRGILGFDYSELSSVIDLCLTININKIFQQICRVVRISKHIKKKQYFKVYPSSLEYETKATILAVMNMSTEEGYLQELQFIKPILADEGFLEENKIFSSSLDAEALGLCEENETESSSREWEYIDFSSFNYLIKTTDILSFKGRNPPSYLDKALKIMQGYKSYFPFKKDHYNSYKIIIRHDPKALRSHFEDCPKERIDWNIELASKACKTYSNRQEMKMNCSGGYKFLLLNAPEILSGNFGKYESYRYGDAQYEKIRWTLDLAKKEALKYKTRIEMTNAARTPYRILYKKDKKYLTEVFGVKTETTKWTLDLARKESLRFENRTDFKNCSYSAYCLLIRKDKDYMQERFPVYRRLKKVKND